MKCILLSTCTCLLLASCYLYNSVNFHYMGENYESTAAIPELYYSYNNISRDYEVIGKMTSDFTTMPADEIQRRLLTNASDRGADAVVIESYETVTKEDCEGQVVQASLLRYFWY